MKQLYEEKVYVCHCGQTHSGEYGIHDYLHHNCLHRSPLIKYVPEDNSSLICVECGQVFQVDLKEAEYYSEEEFKSKVNEIKKYCKHENLYYDSIQLYLSCNTCREIFNLEKPFSIKE